MIPRPDAEAAWVAHLHRLGFELASTRVPPIVIDGTIRISRVGGARPNMVQDAPKMLVEVWHTDAYHASELAHRIASAVEVPDGTWLDDTTKVSRVQTTGPFEFPDPSSDKRRYQFTFDSLVRRVGKRTTGASPERSTP